MFKTRTVKRKNGGREIIRVIDEKLLGSWSESNPIAYEKSVVWLEPIDGLDFVRVAVIPTARSRRGPLMVQGAGMVLGYTKLSDDAPRNPVTNLYTRRVFYLKESDSNLNMNQFPRGAVDPRTILPSLEGDPPRLEERGYPAYMSRAELGLPTPTMTAS